MQRQSNKQQTTHEQSHNRRRSAQESRHRGQRSRESSKVGDSPTTSKDGAGSTQATESGRAMGSENDACPSQPREEGVKCLAKEVHGTALSSGDQRSAQCSLQVGTRE